MINLVLVEDHPFVIEGIKSMLRNEPDILCSHYCSTGAALLSILHVVRPDIILMDINLPDTDGIDLCGQVKQKYPGIFIIALSVNNQPGVIRKMVEQGASGYILKDAGKHELVEALKTVLQGKKFFSYSAITALRKKEVGDLPPLTRREKEILLLIAEGFTNKQIAETLFVDVTTVDSHRKNMLSKYQVKNTSALIKIAFTAKLI